MNSQLEIKSAISKARSLLKTYEKQVKHIKKLIQKSNIKVYTLTCEKDYELVTEYSLDLFELIKDAYYHLVKDLPVIVLQKLTGHAHLDLFGTNYCVCGATDDEAEVCQMTEKKESEYTIQKSDTLEESNQKAEEVMLKYASGCESIEIGVEVFQNENLQDLFNLFL